MMPDTPLAFRDHGGGSSPNSKANASTYTYLLAYKILTQLQKLNTALHVGHPDIAEIPQNIGK